MNPLVSVIVITYNSAKYVLETLESARAQTYQNIELIISDDGSTDKTIETCENWLAENKERFVHSQIITVEKNTGIPANCNRGVKASKGEWIKLIAGDDQLLPKSITDLLENSQMSNIIVGKYQYFWNANGQKRLGAVRPNSFERKFFALDAHSQYKKLLTEPFNFAPATLIRKVVFNKFGFFIEKYKLIEDLPYWLILTRNGQKITFTDHVVVLYRTNHESTSMSLDTLYNIPFMRVFHEFKKEQIYSNVSRWNILYYQSELWDRGLFIISTTLFKNRSSKLQKVVSYFFLITKLRNIVNKLKSVIHG